MAPLQLAMPVLSLQPKEDELTLPPGNGRSDAPFGVFQPTRRLDVVVARPEDPAPAGAGLEIQEATQPVGRDADVGRVKAIPLGAKGDVTAGACLRRAIGEAKVESGQTAPKANIVVVACKGKL